MDKKIISSSDYDKLLISLIPNLHQYHYSAGGEGVAYFIDDNFVIKEYSNVCNEQVFEQIFDRYCEECQMFVEKGYNVPKIYSWIKIPNEPNPYEQKNRYFILEQRARGRELYLSNFSSNYELLGAHICSRQEYEDAMLNRKNPNLRDRIIEEFIKDYLKTNQILEASEKNIEELIISIFKMYVEGIYSNPDVFSRNLIIDNDSKLTLIDNRFINADDLNQKTPVEKLYIDILKILLKNEYLNDYYVEENKIKVESLLFENKKICKELFLKCIRIINHQLEDSKVYDDEVLKELQEEIINMFGCQDGNEILSNIQIEK